MHFGSDPAAAPGHTITVTCRLFGRYAEATGLEAVALTFEGPATAGDAVARIRATLSDPALVPEHPLIAVNQEHAAATRVLRDGDELGLLPPLAGG